MSKPLIVKAHLASPLAGDAPRLDSLLIDRLCALSPNSYPKWMIDRGRALPKDLLSRVGIPLPYRQFGGYEIARCSLPIFAETLGTQRHDYINRKLAVEHADLVRPDRRLKVALGNAEFKSYRLPLYAREVDTVAWFAWAERKPLLGVLKRIKAIGKKISIGYGVVKAWEVEETDQDRTWFAESSHGTLLMTALPNLVELLPGNLVGYTRDFMAVSPPYWHPDRHTEVVRPC